MDNQKKAIKNGQPKMDDLKHFIVRYTPSSRKIDTKQQWGNQKTETESEPCQTSKIEHFAEIIHG